MTINRSVLFAYALIAPVLLWLGATLIYPLLSAIHLSVENVGIIGTQGHFIGLDNYAGALGDTGFWSAIGRSVIWVVGNALVQTPLALGTALILARKFPGVAVARIWIILTWIVPTIVVVIIWRWLLSTSGGMINPLLMDLGIISKPGGIFRRLDFGDDRADPDQFWRWFPFVAVMLLAGIQRIRPMSMKPPRSTVRRPSAGSCTSPGRCCSRPCSC